MSDTLPLWVAEAAKLPLAFAQVREDPRIDQAVVARAGENTHVCMIASGGCTAAVLATLPNVATIHLVDPNPAQLALTRLKLRMLQMQPNLFRLAFISNGGMPFSDRANRLSDELKALGLPPHALGALHDVANLSPDFAGRYERCFAELQRELNSHRNELLAALSLADVAEQVRRVAPGTQLGRRLDNALDSVMSLPNLVALFGEGATRNPVEPFARHFARRIRHAFATLPAATNPFLWQMLAGRYSDGHAADWFMLDSPSRMPDITWQQAFMTDALRDHRETFDVIHLSNILDWLSPEEATATLELTAQALRPGGRVIIRQLNSTLDIPASGPMFNWNTSTAREMHSGDRSFFYRELHFGRKR